MSIHLLHPQRQEDNCGEKRIVIACKKCNNEQGKIEQAEIPLKELRERSKQGHEKKKLRRSQHGSGSS